MLLMSFALVITGCKKDSDKDDPSSDPTEDPSGNPTSDPSGDPSGNPSGDPSGDPSIHPSINLRELVMGNYYWGYGEEGNVSNGTNNYFELSVAEDGKSAVLTGEGELPIGIIFKYDKYGYLESFVVGTHELYGTIKKVQISDDGTKISISGTSTMSRRSGDYVIVLNKQTRSHTEMMQDLYKNKTFTAHQEEPFSANGLLKMTFSSATSAILTHAGECPMEIDVAVDAWGNFDFYCYNKYWTVANGGLTGSFWDDGYAHDWYGNGNRTDLSGYVTQNGQYVYLRFGPNRSCSVWLYK